MQHADLLAREAAGRDVAGAEEGERGIELRDEPERQQHHARVAPRPGSEQAFAQRSEPPRGERVHRIGEEERADRRTARVGGDVLDRCDPIRDEELGKLHREAQARAEADRQRERRRAPRARGEVQPREEAERDVGDHVQHHVELERVARPREERAERIRRRQAQRREGIEARVRDERDPHRERAAVPHFSAARPWR